MAKLKVTRTDGSVAEYEITPSIEAAFETHVKMGFHKALYELQRQTDVYWLCWEAIRRSGESLPPFGDKFLDTLKAVEVLESDPLE
jgi:hypothetical protein